MRSFSRTHTHMHAPVMAEEYVVALIMKRHHAAAVELWVVRKERRQLSTDAQTEARVEVVEDDFRQVRCRFAAVLYVRTCTRTS